MILIGYILLISNLYFGYAFAMLIPQEMGIENPYLNGSLLGVADILGYTFVICTIQKFTRKFYHYFHVFGIIILCLILLLLGFINKDGKGILKIIETILSG